MSGNEEKGSSNGQSRNLPRGTGGGTEYAPAFLLASDEEIRDAYREDLRLVAGLLKEANRQVAYREIGSEAWLDGAGWIDKVRDALDPKGWGAVRRARVMLVGAIDQAVHHGKRMEENAGDIAIMDTLGQRADLDASDLEQCRLAGVRMVLKRVAYSDGRRFMEVAGKDPASETVLFAAYMFRCRCPKFARGLVTSEGMDALGQAVAAWARSRGRPRAGSAGTMTKWEAADTVAKAAGLTGGTAETLEKDWQAHQRWQQPKIPKT